MFGGDVFSIYYFIFHSCDKYKVDSLDLIIVVKVIFIFKIKKLY